MTGEKVRTVFEQMLPQDEIDRLCQPCGVIERQRQLDLGMLVRAMVMSAGTPGGAYQADVLRSSLECEVPRVTRAAFYRWFDEPLERFMEARAPQVDLPGPLRGVKDWSIVDSTTIKVRDARLEDFPGTDLDALLEDDTLVLDGRAIDADMHVGGDTHPLHLRLVGVPTPKGSGFFRTHLPPRVGPRQVADLYRVRWEVELSSKLDTSVNRLDQSDAERPCSVKTLLHASLIASTMAALLAHTPNVQTRPLQAEAPRTQAPLHPRLLALQLAISCQAIAQAFDLKGAEAKRRWDKIAALLTHTGRDPNWRRRPSVLDQLRGRKRQPVARKKAGKRHLNAAAYVDTHAGRHVVVTRNRADFADLLPKAQRANWIDDSPG